MIWQTAALVATLLASGAQAGIGDLVVEGMSRNSPSYERRMQEVAKKTLLARGILESRQLSSGQGSDTVLNPDGTINMTAWDAQANAACITALKALPEASNPSGTCVCYNLPALDSTSGGFEADLRLYKLNVPTGDFAGIPPENIEVGLRYTGASVSPVSPGTAAAKVVMPKLGSRQIATTADDLQLLQTYLFVGQIDKSEISPDITMAQLQALVMPVVTLSGTNAQGQTVSTNVSSNEAAFVAGVFSQEVVMSSFTLANLAVEDEIVRLKNGSTAFVLPGVQILIFPIGLVITGLWTLIGIAAYGYGTFCRYNFREQYRRRILVAEKSAIPRF
ncbi:hypothetical protein B0H66DRAFT_395968 [Apodospora peruviana]|uniref:Uncharacterized protein n=1 Tax=Apodospora peruviana TaxID=516989 RepID=A0AAE0LYE4_9PEZI|nr:hypothetical protein B0H66DRAFT_395968 [Apodospora peruviana]